MYIKQVIIRGFKTYKEQVRLDEDFHQGVNVVVGFNGSGKSNFFNAILFVISDYFGSLRAETRKALLHEGAGPAVLTAFVELVLDNSDRRMPIDKEEVRIRRTIAMKKDDYMLDGKHATKAEVFNLLEGCGFSKSNPYYIVQQGRIAELTLMNDYRRLELMKEISGASFFDTKKAESQKILEDLRARQRKTNEVITHIGERIQNLEEEQRELIQYQKLDRQRRCIEFELTDRDWRTAQDRINELEQERRTLNQKLNDAQRIAVQIREQTSITEMAAQDLTNRRQRTAVERKEAERQRFARSDDLTRAKLELEDEKKNANAGQRSLADAKAELKSISDEMMAGAQEINGISKELAIATSKRRELQQRKQVKETRRDQLFAKQRRCSQYTSVAERNADLQVEAGKLNLRLQKHEKALKSCDDELQLAESKRTSASERLLGLQKNARRLNKDLQERLATEMKNATEKLENCAESKRLLLQERDQIQRRRGEVEREALQYQHRIESCMPRPQRNALSEVLRWVPTQGLKDSVYGTLLDNIDVAPEYQVAAESVAGGALFNLLVKDDSVASQIIALVRTKTLGSIVCTPMNRIMARSRQYPSIPGVKPLVQVVKAAPWVNPVLHQVFGKTVVCSSLQLCDEVSRKYGLDAITIDGDKVSSRGTLTGGYQDPARFVRISNAAKLKLARAKRQDFDTGMRDAERKVQEETSRLEAMHAERCKLQEERGQMQTERARAVELAQEAEKHIGRQSEVSVQISDRMEELKHALQGCRSALLAIEQEMSTTELEDLTSVEKNELDVISKECHQIATALRSAEDDCQSKDHDFKIKEKHLHEVLTERKAQLETGVIHARRADIDERLHERSKLVERLTAECDAISKNLEKATVDLATIDAELASNYQDVETLKAKERDLEEQMAQDGSQVDDLAIRISNLTKKKHEADEIMRNLTCVSADVADWKPLSRAQLMKELMKITKEHGKFEHVNKKAIDQFETFTTQLQDLQDSQKKHNESTEAIEALIQREDEHKEDTIQKTIETVDKHFQTIFSELVHGGIGRLRMLRPEDIADAGADEAAAEVQVSGLRVEVSFTGQSASFLSMAQLSGGQKTVVAISLIFAIQRLEPAPFYLFDEIDAALDRQYRTAVARLIAKESSHAQMVITTFRPEIIETAHRIYRVSQQNRVSRIDPVSLQEARSVIEEQEENDNPEG